MKKIFSFIVALMIGIAANAQTVEHSTFFENTYVTLSGGTTTTTSLFDESLNWNVLRPVVGLEIGKYITPVVGFSIEGIAKYNTLGTSTWVDQHNIIGNVKFNLSNWFAGYKGYPRRIEFVAVPGLGWGHVYGHFRDPEDPRVNVGRGVWTYPTDVNYLTYNIGGEINFNLGKERAWQINVKPSVLWDNMSDTPAGNVLRPLKENFKGSLVVGVTYKFGSKSKNTHNFVLCPYSVTKAEYDAIVAERDTLNKKYIDLLERSYNDFEYNYDDIKYKYDSLTTHETVREIIKEVPVEVIKEVSVGSKHVLSAIITFPIGSAEVSEVEKAKLDVFARSAIKDENVTIVGSADSGTGTDEGNKELSTKRANVVKDILVNEYGFDASKINTSTAFDTNENPNVSRAAILNFIVK